jgi:hypothetical protein
VDASTETGRGARSMARRRKNIGVKLAKALSAKSARARLNYLVDAIFDEAMKNPILDEAMHLLVEVGLGEGRVAKRLLTWALKALKYRG